MKLAGEYQKDIELIDRLFEGDKTIIKRAFRTRGSKGLEATLYYSDGLASAINIAKAIVEPFTTFSGFVPDESVLDFVEQNLLQMPEIKKADEVNDIIRSLGYGDTIVLVDGGDKALIIGSKSFVLRSVEEPEAERVELGPKEGFIESMMMNLSMIKRKLRTNDLKIEYFEVGSTSKTSLAVCYIDGVTDQKVLDYVREKIKGIEIDGIFGSTYVVETINEKKRVFFKRIGTTARPDVVAAKLLEGRVAIVVDGTPQALTIPYVFIEYFQSPSDYYQPSYVAMGARLLRMVSFLFAIVIVPIYLAIINYHPGMLSDVMMVAISQREKANFISALMEAFLLIIAFDLLKEAGFRTPTSLGQSLSIVGALILGQSAVEAKLASPMMIIVVASSCITALLVPNLKNHIVGVRLILIMLSNSIGLFGCAVGLSIFMGVLCRVRSQGIVYTTGLPVVSDGSHEDSLIRKSFLTMKKQNRFIAGARKK